MKNRYSRRLLLLAIGPLFGQCSKAPDAAPKTDYRQEGITLMQQLKPQLTGTWDLRRVAVMRLNNVSPQISAAVTKDTVFQNFAILNLEPALTSRSTPRDPQYGEFEGILQYNGKTFPVYISLRVTSDYAQTHLGPQALFALDFNRPVGSYPPDADERFLMDLGILQGYFYLETTPGQPSMGWRGLGRSVNRIELQKR
ncbi:hypothetical protein [Hymenobacter nivis]|uniref:Uncharacterized protein n=1 Tax=Hymenobacter nivis TaxID=1850093 RepID=A0A502GTY6_9BACT|nr:hypothetical protein [Hymenobacter nivis]TPG65391.1 hypothetical protein EAH73_13015 [Hymenobacter nivis]